MRLCLRPHQVKSKTEALKSIYFVNIVLSEMFLLSSIVSPVSFFHPFKSAPYISVYLSRLVSAFAEVIFILISCGYTWRSFSVRNLFITSLGPAIFQHLSQRSSVKMDQLYHRWRLHLWMEMVRLDWRHDLWDGQWVAGEMLEYTKVMVRMIM